MKLRVVVFGLACVAGAFLCITNTAVAEGNNHAQGTLPASLDQFYPPSSPAPAYLLGMLDLGRLFSGTVCDITEGDMQNAGANLEAFKNAYIKTAALVPEWQDRFPMVPVEDLSEAFGKKDPAQIMPAIEALGAVCHSCHVDYMVPVQQKYRWENFGDLVLTDSLSGRDVSYAQMMLMMETSFDGIGNDLSQGQTAEALKQFEAFQVRFNEMSDNCMTCHDSPRLYYVSDDIMGKISNLGMELRKTNVDPQAAGGLLQKIGQESCSKCHMVHLPATYSQLKMKRN